METRIQKHMKYRADIIKEGTTTMDVSSKPRITGTLPISTVMDSEVSEDDSKYYANQKKIKILQYVIIGLLVALIVTALVLFGIYAFTRG